MMVIDFDPSRKPDLAAAGGHELCGSVRTRQPFRSARMAREAALQNGAGSGKPPFVGAGQPEARGGLEK